MRQNRCKGTTILRSHPAYNSVPSQVVRNEPDWGSPRPEPCSVCLGGQLGSCLFHKSLQVGEVSAALERLVFLGLVDYLQAGVALDLQQDQAKPSRVS